MNYIFFTLKTAYKECAQQLDSTPEPRGSKTNMVLHALAKITAEFTMGDLERACPGVSHYMIRKLLMAQRGKMVECIGKGPGAKWRILGNTLK